ncbi:response regulator [Ramlibacter albus]|uniref:Response regulator n=1 Tax=Ramlibacter albus TaxID=2079448 RepID=A0A923MBB3_9BURK|nr:response regulator [Ramlibacter albus]MBC5767667.1 response regulator [Ramlibacter albus]
MTLRPRVVIVDDDETVLRLMARRLAPFYDVLATGDPRKVKGLLQEHQPHAVLCDIDMPGMGGGELAAAIAADPATSAVPVVFMTELATPDEVDDLGGVISGHPAFSKGAETSVVVGVIEKVCGERFAAG